MKKLLETSSKGFICTPETNLIIPMVNGFINQELYQACYNWVALYYKLPVRFFPLFKDGALKLSEDTARRMQTDYNVECSPAMLLKLYKTYFKEDKDVRALTLAYTDVLKYIKLSDELKDNFAEFLDNTEDRLQHINYISRIQTESVIQKSLKYIDLALRVNRKNMIETLLILETAKDPEMLGNLINLFQSDFEAMLSLPEYAIKEDLCLYVWFFNKVLICESVYKKLSKCTYTRMLCRVCKKLTKTVVCSQNDFDAVRRVFNWSDDLIRYMNFVCMTHLRSRFYGSHCAVNLQDYVKSSAILFSNLARKENWLEEAEIVLDFFELGQARMEYKDLMKLFVEDLDTNEPLKFFEEVYHISSKYRNYTQKLIKCGFLRDANCTCLPQMTEEEATLTFYNRLKYLSTEDVLKVTTQEEIIEVMSSGSITDELALSLFSHEYFKTDEMSEMIMSNRGIARTFKKALHAQDLTSIYSLVQSVLSKASFYFLKETLGLFNSTYFSLRHIDVNTSNMNFLISNDFIKKDDKLVELIAPKILYLGLQKDYEDFLKLLAIYLRDHKVQLDDAECTLNLLRESVDMSQKTLQKIAANVLSEGQYAEFLVTLEQELIIEEDINTQIQSLQKEFEQRIQLMIDFEEIKEIFEEIVSEHKDNSDFVENLFRIMIEKVYEMDDFEEEEAFREEVYNLANDYGIDIEGLEEL